MTVHPDDAELGAGGTIARYVRQGRSVGIVDLTRGELGTRGTAETRNREAERAATVFSGTTRRANWPSSARSAGTGPRSSSPTLLTIGIPTTEGPANW